MTRTTAVVAGAVLVALQIAVLATWVVMREAPPSRDAEAPTATAPESSAALQRRLRSIEERIAEVGERLSRLDRAGESESEVSGAAPARRRVDPQRDTRGGATEAREVHPRFADVATRHLLLEADERLQKKDDLAGAIARYETVLARELDVEQRAGVTRVMGLAYVKLDQPDRGLRLIRDAVEMTDASSPSGANARFDLLSNVERQDDVGRRELLELAREYLSSGHTNAFGREWTHYLVSAAASKLGDTVRQRESLEYLAERSSRHRRYARQGLTLLDGK